jgi:hypothetical protein
MSDRLIRFETAEEQDARAVKLGFMSEEERILRAYNRIHREAVRRSFLRRTRGD